MAAFLIILAVFLVLFFCWRFVFFFRNPKRIVAVNEDHILAPADGTIIYIKKVVNNHQEPIFSIKGRHVIQLTDLMHVDDERLLERPGLLIGIFMGPFNVHYNRAPIGGTIRRIAYDFPQSKLCARKNKVMFNALSNLFFDEKPYTSDCDYLIDNERASYVIKNSRVSVYVTQIADAWVKKIICFKDQQDIMQGEIFGLVRMGSQVDIFVPEPDEYEVMAMERQKVKAGISVLLKRKADMQPTMQKANG